MYTGLKHTHMLLALLSVSLFVLRFIWLMRGSPMLQRKWVKVLPHTIDTLLLLLGLGLLALVPWYQQPWFWEKLILVLSYIGFGFVVMKFAKRARSRSLAFVLAMLCVAGIAHLAYYKTPFLLG